MVVMAGHRDEVISFVDGLDEVDLVDKKSGHSTRPVHPAHLSS